MLSQLTKLWVQTCMHPKCQKSCIYLTVLVPVTRAMMFLWTLQASLALSVCNSCSGIGIFMESTATDCSASERRTRRSYNLQQAHSPGNSTIENVCVIIVIIISTTKHKINNILNSCHPLWCAQCKSVLYVYVIGTMAIKTYIEHRNILLKFTQCLARRYRVQLFPHTCTFCLIHK